MGTINEFERDTVNHDVHSSDFTDDQKQYLNGFAVGNTMAKTMQSLPIFHNLAGGSNAINGQGNDDVPIDISIAAQNRTLSSGGSLCQQEKAKRRLHGFDTWDLISKHARDGSFPKGTDVFLAKFQGMFYVAPAQDSFMCRLRLPGGIMQSYQMRGIADLAQRFGGGYTDVTTRANLQIREIGPTNTIDVLQGLHELGVINRGAGADSVRNITASATAGIDPNELIDTQPLARQVHHALLNNRRLHGLPRKFNIAFDGGGAISTLEDTNDVGFTAVRIGENQNVAAGIYFRLALGGITGHKEFARDTGVLLSPDQCLPVAVAAIRVFINHGDRTDRNKARLKYVLERMGFDGFLAKMQKYLPFEINKAPIDSCEIRPAIRRNAHIGIHPQKQNGLHYLGIVLPVGRITHRQMRCVADIADAYGSKTIRLTVWQNLLIPDIPTADVKEVKRLLDEFGLPTSANSVRAGLVACTGNAGCKYAAANTKLHAMNISDYLDNRIKLDTPINIHLTGCHHSCAQHYIGDIGLLGAQVPPEPDSEIRVEGYHMYVGGGFADQQRIGRELLRNIAADKLPQLLERLLNYYLSNRHPEESFQNFTMRHDTKTLSKIILSN